MVGAKINGMIVPIDRIPRTGEIIEILTSSASKGPSRDWLKIVKTGEARNKIRQWFKKEKRAENIAVGRGEIDRELKHFGRAITDAEKNEIITNVSKRIGMQDPDDLFNTIGYGGLSVSKISVKLRDEYDRIVRDNEEAPPVEVEDVKVERRPKNLRSNSGIIVDGETGCLVKFAKCCNPLPGDELAGFITKGYGISIHKADCPNVISGKKSAENASRWVNAYWEHDYIADNNGVYEALIQLYVDDRIKMIADITYALADMKVSILQINSQAKSNNTALINVTVGAKNVGHLKSILSRLRSIDGVNDVRRGVVGDS